MSTLDKIKKGLKTLTEGSEEEYGNRIKDMVDVAKNELDIDEPEAKDWVAGHGIGEEEQAIKEKAESKSQQRFMGMVYHCQKTGDCASERIRKAAASMKQSDAEDFASTKHSGLPEKVEENPIDSVVGDDYQSFIDQELSEETNVEELSDDVQKLLDTLDMSVIQNHLKKLDKPVEKAEMIAQFAEMIGVPRPQLGTIIQQIKNISKQPQPQLEEDVGDNGYDMEEEKSVLKAYHVAKHKAKRESANGYSQHVYVGKDRYGDFGFWIGDWYDSSNTVASYDRGETNHEEQFTNLVEIEEWVADHAENYYDDDELSENVNPKMNKSDLIEAITGKKQAKVIKRIKVKDIK